MAKAANKKVWDEVQSVEPQKSTEKPKVSDDPEEGVPFGSKSDLQKLIIAYRKHFKKTTPDKNGQATAPNGTPYSYYLSSDVFEHADEFVSQDGYMLDLHNHVSEAGHNIMQLVLEDIESGEKKVVEANLGSPNTMGDFGARITYAPKYLLAIMFGISVQTDTDAFNNGTVKTVGQPMPVTESKPQQTPQVQNVTSTPEVTTTAPVTTTGEPSKSYQKAHEFITKASLPEMLDQALTKVENSSQMSDSEKVQLKQLIEERRSSLAQ